DVNLQEITVHDVVQVDGQVLYADSDSFVVALARFTARPGTEYQALGTSVTIPRNHIADLEQRRVSALKTSLLLTGGAAAILAIVYSVGQLSGSGTGTSPEPPPQP